MQAALLSGPGDLQIKNLSMPVCPQDGVLVRVRACGICSADSKMVSKGHRALVYPRVLGHEISGEVVQSRSEAFQKGDRVQVAPGLRCGRCYYCLKGADNQCLQRQILGFTLDGGFAEYIALPVHGPLQAGITHLPANLDFDLATLAEPLACCLNALSKMSIQDHEVVLVAGAGLLGLLFAFAALENRAGKLIFSEPEQERRQRAIELGAARAIDPQQEDLLQIVKQETNGKGSDLLFLATSQMGLEEELLEVMARGGRISLFSGLAPEYARSGFDLNLIHYKELELTGAYGCTAAQNTQAIRLIFEQRHFFKKMISKKVNFEHLEEALVQCKAKKGLKTVLEV